jgi:hypothetical protein
VDLAATLTLGEQLRALRALQRAAAVLGAYLNPPTPSAEAPAAAAAGGDGADKEQGTEGGSAGGPPVLLTDLRLLFDRAALPPLAIQAAGAEAGTGARSAAMLETLQAPDAWRYPHMVRRPSPSSFLLPSFSALD